MKYLSWKFIDSVLLLAWGTIVFVSFFGFLMHYWKFPYANHMGFFLFVAFQTVCIYRLGVYFGKELYIPFGIGLIVFPMYLPQTNVDKYAEVVTYAFVLALTWIPIKYIVLRFCVCKTKKRLQHEAMLKEMQKALMK